MTRIPPDGVCRPISGRPRETKGMIVKTEANATGMTNADVGVACGDIE